MRSFHKRLARLAQSSVADVALTDANANISTQMTAAQAGGGYTPQFRGMYVFTEKTGVQTKLFDYVAPIRPGDRVDVLDIDHDADRDYVFLLGGVLYVKKTHLDEVKIPKIMDTHAHVTEIRKEIPEVPNNFLQTLSTPSELNVIFHNTVKDETEWRMEFFDSYLEWDRVAIGSHRQSENPKTTVDLFRAPEATTRRDEALSSVPVARSLESGYNAEGFRLE